MFAVVIALFFAAAAVFAVLSIARTFSGAAERIDALFAEYRALEMDRTVRSGMRPAVRFVPAAAPDYAPRNVIAFGARQGVSASISQSDWRAAA
ncbi:hypothetical protein [Blastomonas sp. AAP53]|uniref:hypothetical protein n=1 Tax=Blastomonas sp. AAP53 TaxID=1248760 RepID=UPI00030FBA90|nr:hypothetical protein [Blastomonas sp. AAP53]